jgi:SAM-dependent methyltransferase
MPPLFSIILPTWNLPQYFNPCMQSIGRTGILQGLGEVIVINNGSQAIAEEYKDWPSVKVLTPGENLGWERGLELGLKHSTAPFVCFQNDDTFIPHACNDFYQALLYPLADKSVAAVGPTTTTAAGWHSIYRPNPVCSPTDVSYLIFFTVMVRRSAYDAAGGIDTSCPGGDDLDLSIRFRKAGQRLVVNPKAFLIHHAFKTGERVRGGPDTPGGWNSKEMSDKTNQWLIKKHGFKAFFETINGLAPKDYVESEDKEGKLVASLVSGEKVVELGCGFRKTVPEAVGIDRVPKGEPIPHVPGGLSVADIVADADKRLPLESFSQDTVIARHILEHCIDSVDTLKEWNRILKIGGRLIVAVPNEEICPGIPLNPEHVHAFTPKSLKSLLAQCGFDAGTTFDPQNHISVVGCFEKILHVSEETQPSLEAALA